MSERLPNGYFAPGNKASPGRKPRAVEMRRLAVMSEIVTEDKWRAVVKAALEDAIDGSDYIARDKGRRFIAEYLIGKPKQTIEVAKAPDESSGAFDDYSDEALIAIASGDEAAKRYNAARIAADAIAGSGGAETP